MQIFHHCDECERLKWPTRIVAIITLILALVYYFEIRDDYLRDQPIPAPSPILPAPAALRAVSGPEAEGTRGCIISLITEPDGKTKRWHTRLWEIVAGERKAKLASIRAQDELGKAMKDCQLWLKAKRGRT